MTKVLFVDDEQSALDGLRRSLHKHCKDWEMRFAVGGEEAIALMAEQAPDVLISDMRMPGMDGSALLRVAQERWPGTARLLLSGYSDSEAIMRSTLVAHQFMSKPCDGEELRETVDRASALTRLIGDPAVRDAIGEVDKLPAVPETYRQLTKVLALGEVSLDMVGKVVAKDPVIAAKLLQLVNSSFFGLSRSIKEVRDAVSHLGLDVVRDLVLTLGAFSCPGVPEATQRTLRAVAKRSMAVATVARAIAPEEHADAAYSAGLLVDVGQTVIAMRMPEGFERVAAQCASGLSPRVETEREVIGADHAAIGAFLLTQWGLPYDLTSSVAFCHRPSELGCDAAPILTALHVADALVEEVVDSSWREGAVFDHEYLERARALEQVEEWRGAASVALATTEDD
ncbi:MAG: HDOD domain-containing protein [Myxococcota bacterium]